MAEIVLINPRFDASYWGLEHALPIGIGRDFVPRADLVVFLSSADRPFSETERALRQAELAVAEGAPWLPHVDSGLSLTALHDHARFRALITRMRRGGTLGDESDGAPRERSRPIGSRVSAGSWARRRPSPR